jgi:hypothetical protein
MRKTSWLLPLFVLAIAAVLLILAAGDLPMARGVAIIPFLLLLIGIATGPRQRGWACAAAGVAVTALALGSFASPAGDAAGEAGIGIGVATLTAAMLGSGGWRAAMRHRVLFGVFVAGAGFFTVAAVLGIATSLRAALNPPAQCVDTCFGPALAVFLSAIILAEVLIAALVAAAFARGALTGFGALIMAAGANTLFYLAPPAPTPGDMAGIVAWLGGLYLVALPWLRRAAGDPAPSGDAQPALE